MKLPRPLRIAPASFVNSSEMGNRLWNVLRGKLIDAKLFESAVLLFALVVVLFSLNFWFICSLASQYGAHQLDWTNAGQSPHAKHFQGRRPRISSGLFHNDFPGRQNAQVSFSYPLLRGVSAKPWRCFDVPGLYFPLIVARNSYVENGIIFNTYNQWSLRFFWCSKRFRLKDRGMRPPENRTRRITEKHSK